MVQQAENLPSTREASFCTFVDFLVAQKITRSLRNKTTASWCKKRPQKMSTHARLCISTHWPMHKSQTAARICRCTCLCHMCTTYCIATVIAACCMPTCARTHVCTLVDMHVCAHASTHVFCTSLYASQYYTFSPYLLHRLLHAELCRPSVALISPMPTNRPHRRHHANFQPIFRIR